MVIVVVHLVLLSAFTSPATTNLNLKQKKRKTYKKPNTKQKLILNIVHHATVG